MRKTTAVLGSALFFAVAPASMAELVPWWITRLEFRLSGRGSTQCRKQLPSWAPLCSSSLRR